MQRRRQQRERQKAKAKVELASPAGIFRGARIYKNSARASSFFVHFFAVVAELRWENASFHVFVEDVNKRRLNFLSLSELKYGSIIGIRLKKSSLVFDKKNELE